MSAKTPGNLDALAETEPAVIHVQVMHGRYAGHSPGERSGCRWREKLDHGSAPDETRHQCVGHDHVPHPGGADYQNSRRV